MQITILGRTFFVLLIPQLSSIDDMKVMISFILNEIIVSMQACVSIFCMYTLCHIESLIKMRAMSSLFICGGHKHT